jgi:hypothetical protein
LVDIGIPESLSLALITQKMLYFMMHHHTFPYHQTKNVLFYLSTFSSEKFKPIITSYEPLVFCRNQNYSETIQLLRQNILRCFTLSIFIFLLKTSTRCQSIRPSIFLSQIEMTPLGGQPYDEFYWLNSNNATLKKTSVNFLATGTYRFDVSAYKQAGMPNLAVKVDGVIVCNITVTTMTIGIFSGLSSKIFAGTHTLEIQLTNFNSAANYCRVGLLYGTQTNISQPYVFAPIKQIPIQPGQILKGAHFASGHLRGFNCTTFSTTSALSAKDFSEMRHEGANLARCWLSINHNARSSNYFFCDDSGNPSSTSLTVMDQAVSMAEQQGFYIMLTLEVLPEQCNTDLWGTSASAIGRRNGVKTIWQQLAKRYKGRVGIGGYDLINEPRCNYNYAEFLRWQMEMVEAIRAVDPDHVIAIESLANDMFAMMLPLLYDNIVYSPHGYATLNITHQGITTYLKESPLDPSQTIRNKYPTITNSSNLTAPWGKIQLSQQHDDVRTFSRRFNVPVWIGEFSCVNWSPLNDAGEWTSTKWCYDNISLLEREHWAWCYHAWNEFEAWDARIPSSYYNLFTFKNAAPFTKSTKPVNWSGQKTESAPTIAMLRKWFALNVESSSLNIHYNENSSDEHLFTKNLAAKVYPNPGIYYFNLHILSKSTQPLIVKLMDLTGKLLETRIGVIPNNALQLGDNLRAGVYIIKVIQGNERVQIKVVKN